MSKQLIQQVVENFIDTTTSQVLAVTGAWGVGKTHALKGMIESYNGSGSLKKYSYTSVFGTQSVSEIRTSLLAKTKTFPAVSSSKWSVFAWAGRQARKFKTRETFDQLKEMLPWGGKHLAIAIETIASSFVKNTLIILDDIERLGDKVKLDDLMGLVSELKEQHSCKVILILNEAELGPERQTVYAKYAEKVIDQKLEFVMTPDEAILLGLPLTTPLRDLLLAPIRHLGITNIRVIQKVESTLRIIYPFVQHSSDFAKQQAATSVPIFACALYEQSRGFPDPDKILKYNALTHRMLGSDLADAGKNLEWVSKLELCGFVSADEFDETILDTMRSGYVDHFTIQAQIEAIDVVANHAQLNEIFSGAWRLFHDRLDVSVDELASAFVDAVRQAFIVITPRNLNSMVKLLRELGRDSLADEAIEIYIQNRRDTPQLFDIQHQSRLGEIDDAKLHSRFLDVAATTCEQLSLQATAQIVIENDQWDDAVVPAFLRADTERLVDLLKANQGPGLHRLVTGIMRLPCSKDEQEKIHLNMVAALTAIGKESLLNKIRVKRWGVDLDA
jgi:hypothetical protein